jgi:hypothetical protein
VRLPKIARESDPYIWLENGGILIPPFLFLKIISKKFLEFSKNIFEKNRPNSPKMKTSAEKRVAKRL